MAFIKKWIWGSPDSTDTLPAGKPRATPKPPPKQAVKPQGGIGASMEQLGNTNDMLEKKSDLLAHKIDEQTAMAKKHFAAGNKAGALACMKRKKLYEEQLAKTDAQRMNMEKMGFVMQETAMNQQVLDTQRQVGRELERANAAMDADQVEDDMDRIREAMEKQKEVADMLGQDLGTDLVDDDDLLAELNELSGVPAVAVPQQAVAPQRAPSLDMPAVPTGDISAPKVSEDDDELARLEAELNA
jgi:charged multivesicular body protein 4